MHARVLLIVSFLAACGCSGSDLNAVRGKVTHRSEPAAGAVVVFHPVGATLQSQRPSAVTDAGGNFTLMTGPKTGSPGGDYTVTITWPDEKAAKSKSKRSGTDQTPEELPDRLKGRYSDPTTTTLKATIRSGDNALPTFEVN